MKKISVCFLLCVLLSGVTYAQTYGNGAAAFWNITITGEPSARSDAATVGYVNARTAGPDSRPSQPTYWDDEFRGNSLNPKWQWNNQSNATATVANGYLTLNAPAQTQGDVWREILQPLPSGTWEFTSKISYDTTEGLTPYLHVGLLLRETSTNDMVQLGFGYNGSFADIGVGSWADTPTMAKLAPVLSLTNAENVMYVRTGFDGTNIYESISSNGVHFTKIAQFAPTAYFAEMPDKVGLGVDTFNATNSVSLICDWFRRTK